MGASNLTIILTLEALLLCMFVALLIFLKNRKLHKVIKLLKARLSEVGPPSKKSEASSVAPSFQQETPYSDKLDQHLALTKDYHYSLGTRQDIALDLDPDAPIARRTAALRHAFLIAEKEATAGTDAEPVNWNFLASRYQQLLAFNEDYTPDTSERLQEDLQQTQEELQLAKKRVNNLERFKTMYFELEARWEKCKDQADEYYSELREMAAETEKPEDFNKALEQYHATYSAISVIIDKGLQEEDAAVEIDPTEESASGHVQEIRRLRTVAAEQHVIIAELQSKLRTTSNNDERAAVVENLQSELNKQTRFIQESETCIQLMETELKTANRELDQLRNRAGLAAQLKAQLKELKTNSETHEQIIGALKQENRRLSKKLKLAQEAPPEESPENRALRKEVSTLQSKYNDLEEKFLNLKLKG